MNENARKWVEALRSGEYKQATGVLHDATDGDHFCCLGVACDLYQKIMGGLEVTRSFYADIILYGGETDSLPKSVREWLGLRDFLGEYAGGGGSLARANDSGCSFSEIADIIESEPEGLFG